jgi:hypothetical protein
MNYKEKLTIYRGKEKPMVAVGPHETEMLGFAERFRCWHYIPDGVMGEAVMSLASKGCLVIDGDKYRFAG